MDYDLLCFPYSNKHNVSFSQRMATLVAQLYLCTVYSAEKKKGHSALDLHPIFKITHLLIQQTLQVLINVTDTEKIKGRRRVLSLQTEEFHIYSFNRKSCCRFQVMVSKLNCMTSAASCVCWSGTMWKSGCLHNK